MRKIARSRVTRYLANPLILDDRKSIAHWIVAQGKYSKLEAEKIGSLPFAQLGWPDKLRKMVIITPWLVPLYCLLVKKAFLAGRHGIFYCFQRAASELMLSLYLLEKKIQKITDKHDEH